MTEIIFEVTEDDVDGGYSASALGHGIHTQGESVEEIRSNVKEAVDCYFDDTMPRPKVIRLHFVRDEVRQARDSGTAFTPRASLSRRSAATSRRPSTATSTTPCRDRR